MSILDDLQTVLPDMRQNARNMMTDTCEIRRPGTLDTDPDTGIDVFQPGELIYTGVCKLQTSGGIGAENTSLGGLVVSWSERLDLPWGTSGLAGGMIATMLTARDEQLAGMRVRLVSPQSVKSHATAVRWNVKEMS